MENLTKQKLEWYKTIRPTRATYACNPELVLNSRVLTNEEINKNSNVSFNHSGRVTVRVTDFVNRVRDYQFPCHATANKYNNKLK
jgi:hypothetical protein